MAELKSEFLFKITFIINQDTHALGAVPTGTRRIVTITGGDFAGPRLRGKVASAPGAAWVLVRGDGVVQLHARIVLQTDDGALIYMHYPGLGHGPPEVMARVNSGQAVTPEQYYFRIAPMFETSSADYEWLNKIIAVGVGERAAAGPIYDVYQIL